MIKRSLNARIFEGDVAVNDDKHLDSCVMCCSNPLNVLHEFRFCPVALINAVVVVIDIVAM